MSTMPVDAVKADIALDMLRDCLNGGNVIPGKHFRDELANEAMTIPDAW